MTNTFDPTRKNIEDLVQRAGDPLSFSTDCHSNTSVFKDRDGNPSWKFSRQYADQQEEPSEPEYLTTETDAGFRAIMMSGDFDNIKDCIQIKNGPEWHRAMCFKSYEEIIRMLHFNYVCRIKNPNFKQPKPQPTMPSGWVKCEVGDRAKDYYWDDTENKWDRATSWTVVKKESRICIKPAPGFEGHDANWWKKQPEEIYCFAADHDFEWFKYDKMVEINKTVGRGEWSDDNGCGYAKMWPSECPKNFKGDWRDSLMVRPDKLGGE